MSLWDWIGVALLAAIVVGCILFNFFHKHGE